MTIVELVQCACGRTAAANQMRNGVCPVCARSGGSRVAATRLSHTLGTTTPTQHRGLTKAERKLARKARDAAYKASIGYGTNVAA
jgi:hypothetical protein